MAPVRRETLVTASLRRNERARPAMTANLYRVYLVRAHAGRMTCRGRRQHLRGHGPCDTSSFPTLLAVSCALALETGSAQTRAVDAERLLTERFGFTPAEVAQARSGQAVAKLLPSQDPAEVGVLGAVRINTASDRLVVWLKDVASFRKAAELGLSRRLSDPPQIGDFADLSLDADELYALRDCRPGKCDLRLGDKAIQQFQTGVDWTAGDATRRANLLTRQLMLNLAQAYLAGGDQALGAYHDEKTPRSASDEFLRILRSSTGLHEIAPPLAAYLERFPGASCRSPNSCCTWGKGGVGPEASITLHQLDRLSTTVAPCSSSTSSSTRADTPTQDFP